MRKAAEHRTDCAGTFTFTFGWVGYGAILRRQHGACVCPTPHHGERRRTTFAASSKRRAAQSPAAGRERDIVRSYAVDEFGGRALQVALANQFGAPVHILRVLLG